MQAYTQDQRSLAISDFGLGKDTFLLSNFEGTEYISDLFLFEITVLSENFEISASDIIGHTATVKIQTDTSRVFHGVIRDFSFGELKDEALREYKMTMVPWLWLLTKTNNHRIFQEKNTKDIVSEILTMSGFTDFDFQAVGGETREYCVQHNESDFHFISRLLEEEGIAYHFMHTEDKHKLLITEQANAFQPCEESEIEYITGSKDGQHIFKWERQHRLKTGRWTLNDYDFTMPQKDLTATTAALSPFDASGDLEHYEYPGLYKSSSGEPLIKLRMETEETKKDIVAANSKCVSFHAGGRFNLVCHDAARENGSYVITKIKHTAYDISYLSGDGNRDKKKRGSDYYNRFSCIPFKTPFRPEQRHQRPIMRGAQSAVVVGPAGEEIYIDEFGRIKVQFIWDREGQHNERSSCFLRVMQVWAGNKWGASFIPRIGHEVIVDFLDGDPDRPIVSGTVYNGKNRPPYGSKTQSGIKSRSTKGASSSNFNELRFDDKFGEEQVYIQAEKNQDNLVKNNETTNVGNDRTETIGNNETISIGNDRKEDVGNNETITIGNNRTEKVGSNEDITIDSNRTENVGSDETIKIGSNRTENVGSNETVTVKKLRTHNVGINDMLNVGAAQEVTVGGFRMLNVGLYQNRNTGLNLVEKVGKKITIDAGDEILIKTGDASLNMKSDGTIILKGKDIDIDAGGDMTLKAKMNLTEKAKKILKN